MATVPHDYAPASAAGTAGVGSGATVSVAIPWDCAEDTPLAVEVVSLATGAVRVLMEDGEPAGDGGERYVRVLDEDGRVVSVTASNWFGAATAINAYVRRAVEPAQEWSPRSSSGANLRTLEASLNGLAKSVQQLHAEVFGNEDEDWGGGVVRVDDALRIAPAEVRADTFPRFDADGEIVYDDRLTDEMLEAIASLGTMAFEDADAVAVDIVPDAAETRDLGSAARRWAEVHAQSVRADEALLAGAARWGGGDVRILADGQLHGDDSLMAQVRGEGGGTIDIARLRAAHGPDSHRVVLAAGTDVMGIGTAYAVNVHAATKVQVDSGKTYMVGGGVNHPADILAWFITNGEGVEYEGMRLIDGPDGKSTLGFEGGGRIVVKGPGATPEVRKSTTLEFADPGAASRTITFPAASGTVALTTDGHSPVTLSTEADGNLLGLSGQQLTLDAQIANRVFAGPTGGGSAAPTFRALVDADIPNALTIAGGTIDSTPIGTTAPSTGAFTTLALGDGTAAVPAITFASDANTGIYRMGEDGLAFTTAGARKFFAANSYVTFDVQTFAVSGSSSFPSWAFASDANTGIYRVAEDRIGFATGGALGFSVENSGVTVTNQCVGKAGSAASPSFAFAGDGNTGWFSGGADQIGGSCGGSQAFTLTATGINSTAIGATTPSTGRFTTLATTATMTSYGSPAISVAMPSSGGTTIMRAEDVFNGFGAGHTIFAVGRGSGVGPSEFATHTYSLGKMFDSNSGSNAIASIDMCAQSGTQLGGCIELMTRATHSGASVSRLRVEADGGVTLRSATSATAALVFGMNDTANLYRSAADTLATDDSFVVGGQLFVGNVVSGVADLPLYYDISTGAVTSGGIACPAVFVDGEPVGEILVAGDPYSALNVKEGLLMLGRLAAGEHLVEVVNLKDFRDHVRSVSIHAVEAIGGVTAMRPLAWRGPATLADDGDSFITLAKGESFALVLALDGETDVAMRATGFYEARENVWSERKLAELAELRRALSA